MCPHMRVYVAITDASNEALTLGSSGRQDSSLSLFQVGVQCTLSSAPCESLAGTPCPGAGHTSATLQNAESREGQAHSDKIRHLS